MDTQTICDVKSDPNFASIEQLCSDVASFCVAPGNLIRNVGVDPSCENQTLTAACTSSSGQPFCYLLSAMCSLYLPPSTSIPAQIRDGNTTVAENPAQTLACTGFNNYCSNATSSNFCSGAPSVGIPTGTVDLCFDQYTGWTYDCGDGSQPIGYQEPDDYSSTILPPGNYTSLAPVTDASYKPDKTTTDPSGSNKEYTFQPGGNCYAVTLIPSGVDVNELGWVEQSSSVCSNSNAFSTAAVAQEGYPLLPNIGNTITAQAKNNCANKNCLVSDYINPLIRFLNIAVSLVVVIAVVIAGIQYSTSRDDPEAVKSAKKRIMNAMIGLVSYFLFYAFLNFIIPGGV